MLRKTPPKFPVAESTLKTFKSAPPSLFQTEGDRPWAEAAAADATRTNKAAMIRYMFFFSRRWVVMCRYCTKIAKDHKAASTCKDYSHPLRIRRYGDDGRAG